jgi:hypothetical protein
MGAGPAIHDLLANPAVREDTSQFVAKTFKSMGAEFQKSEAGKSLYNVVKEDYLPSYDKFVTELGNSYLAKGIKKPSFIVRSEARNMAAEQSFGKQHELIAAHLAAAAKEIGDPESPHVKNLADNMAMILHDNDVKPVFKNKKLTELRRVSETKYNALRDPKYGKELTRYFDANPVYEPSTDAERMMHTFANTTMAPLAGIGHLGTFANAMFSTPFKSLNASLIDAFKDYKGTQQMLAKSGVFAEDVLNTTKQQVDYRQGKLASFLPGSVADYLNRAIHVPGLRGIRNLQTTMYGSAGYHTAIDMAEKLASDPKDARALYELRDMHIDPAEVIKQGGKLTEDQIQAGIYHYVNNHVFLHPETERAFNALKNPWTRQASMFHSFTSAQGRFIRNEMRKAYTLKGSDPIAATRAISTLLVAFPTMGFAVRQLESVGRGENSDIHGQIENLKGERGTKAQVEEYLDDFSYVAGFGIASSYVRGASRNALGNMLLGPIGNALSRTLVTDPYRFYESGDIKPELRDLITYALPDNLGKIITHYALPTKAEKNKGKMHSLRMKGMKGLSIN